MLIGEYRQNLDAKGRVNVPAKFRADLGESFVVSRGLDECVCIYPKEEWESFKENLRTVPSSKRRALERFFFSASEECMVDAQGRTLIPPEIRKYAGLEKEVVVVGLSEKVEIWDRAKWDTYMQKPEFEADAIADIMEELGL